MLEQKADISDLDKICGILENKAEVSAVDQVRKQLREQPSLATLNELNILIDKIEAKANREDIDHLFQSLQGSKTDQEKRILALEKDVDKGVGNLCRDMETLKASVVSSLNKKSGFCSSRTDAGADS